MSRHLATVADYLKRTASLLAPGSNSTVMCWVKFGTVPVAPAYTLAYGLLDDPAVYTDYITIDANSVTSLELGGTGPLSAPDGAPSVGTWYFCAWVQSATTQEFFVSALGSVALSAGSFVLDRSAFTVGFELAGNDTFASGNIDIAFVRSYQSALTISQIQAEQYASASVLGGAFMDTPLISTLNDISGNGRNWTQVGSGSYTASPFPATYLDITAFPYSRVITQAEFNGGTFGGVANQVWFRFYTPTQVVFGGTCNSGGTFTPHTFLYFANGTSVYDDITGSTGWHYVLTAGTYWVKIVRNAGGASNFDFTAQFDTTTLNPSLPTGAIVINDDAAGFVASAWQPDGTFLGMMTAIPAGETGGSVPTGVSLWQDRFGAHAAANSVSLNNASGAYLTSANASPVLTDLAIVANDTTKFWVLNRSNGKIATVTQGGVVTNAVATISATTYSAMGVNPAGTIAYWAEGYDNPSIHRHNLATDTPMTDLYTVPELSGGDTGSIALTAVNENPGEILVLSDDSVVTWYHNVTLDKNVLLHISAAGALLHSYTYTGSFQYIDHIHYAPDNPAGIHIWFFETSGASTGRIGHLVIATGVLDVSFDTELFSSGQNIAGADIFGPSASCTMVTVLYAGTTTGSLEIVKVTVPAGSSQSFDFTAGGVTPTTFTLIDGGSELYTGLTPGNGYSISEAAVANWVTTYDVSNASPIGALQVNAGEVTTVTVTNTSSAIVVIKETAPTGSTTVFDFVGSGDGVDASFSLSDGQSVTFDALTPGGAYSIVETSQEGWATTYEVSNGSPNANLTITAGDTITVTVTNAGGANTREYWIRRERSFPVLNNEQMRMFFSFLQIDLQAGNGLGNVTSDTQGSDPLLELDWSDDGGWSWSNIHFLPTGKIGAYNRRAIARMLGHSRQRVFRIAVSDPVQWVIIDGYMKMTMGTS